MGQVGLEWSVAGIAADPPVPANAQLVQAMASVVSGTGVDTPVSCGCQRGDTFNDATDATAARLSTAKRHPLSASVWLANLLPCKNVGTGISQT